MGLMKTVLKMKNHKNSNSLGNKNLDLAFPEQQLKVSKKLQMKYHKYLANWYFSIFMLVVFKILFNRVISKYHFGGILINVFLQLEDKVLGYYY